MGFSGLRAIILVLVLAALMVGVGRFVSGLDRAGRSPRQRGAPQGVGEARLVLTSSSRSRPRSDLSLSSRNVMLTVP